MAASLIVGATIFLSIELTFCILTVLYMKRNVLEGDTSVKKAVAKVLGYMAVVSLLSFINSVLPHSIAITFRSATTGTNLTHYITMNYVIGLFTNITAFPTPIVTIILLKPVRDAIKTMSKKVSTCICCHKNRECSATTEEHHTNTTSTTTTEEHPATGITEVSLPTTKQGLNIHMPTTGSSSTTDQNMAITGQSLASAYQNPVTNDQNPATTDQCLTISDQNLAYTDQSPTTTWIVLDTIQVATID